MAFPLAIVAGRSARAELSKQGWHPALFTAMVGASGGAKLLGIAHLDRFLFGDFLQRSQHPMALYGSSIGAWRHAALTAPDPLAAVTLLQERYLHQQWDEDDPRHPREVVDGLCQWVLDGLLTDELIDNLIDHPRYSTHIVTALGRGLNNRRADFGLGIGMGLAALGNLLHRELLARGFQRVVFSNRSSNAFQFSDFNTRHVPLTREAVRPAITATASIPFLMSGVRDIPSAPAGQYWDGGIIDYHFDFANHQRDKDGGLTLYPHFSELTIKGWFDKNLPWRRNSARLMDRVVLVAPSASYLKQLPSGKIPDRKDFATMSQDDRIGYWQAAVDSSRLLAEAMQEVVSHTDPLHFLYTAD